MRREEFSQYWEWLSWRRSTRPERVSSNGTSLKSCCSSAPQSSDSWKFCVLIILDDGFKDQTNKPDIAEDCSSQQEHCARVSFNNSIRWIMSPQDRDCQEQQQRYQRPHALNEVSHLARLVFVGSVKIVKHHRQVRHGSAVQNCFKEMSTSEAVGWQRNLPHVITEEPADGVHRDRAPHSKILKLIWKSFKLLKVYETWPLTISPWQVKDASVVFLPMRHVEVEQDRQLNVVESHRFDGISGATTEYWVKTDRDEAGRVGV